MTRPGKPSKLTQPGNRTGLNARQRRTTRSREWQRAFRAYTRADFHPAPETIQ